MYDPIQSCGTVGIMWWSWRRKDIPSMLGSGENHWVLEVNPIWGPGKYMMASVSSLLSSIVDPLSSFYAIKV